MTMIGPLRREERCENGALDFYFYLHRHNNIFNDDQCTRIYHLLILLDCGVHSSPCGLLKLFTYLSPSTLINSLRINVEGFITCSFCKIVEFILHPAAYRYCSHIYHQETLWKMMEKLYINSTQLLSETYEMSLASLESYDIFSI
ncbi:hypothetical protein LguiB_013264 [Lonicera macranthoides]